MKTYILLEYNRDETKIKLGRQLLDAANRHGLSNINVVLNALEQIDPTKNKQYVLWLVKHYIRDQIKLEDAQHINNVLVKFEQIKNKLDQRDINQYAFSALEKLIDREFNVTISNTVDNDEQQNLYKGTLGRLDLPKTENAAKLLGRGTRWCISANENNAFFDYITRGPIYIWKDKSGEKYCFQFETMEMRDSHDKQLSPESLNFFRTKHPVLSNLFAIYEKQLLETNESEDIYDYAFSIIRGRWPEGEEILASDPYYSYKYAREIIKGRWIKGEAAIASNADYAFRYARDVINERFPKGEPEIMASILARRYKAFVKSLK